MFLRIRLASEAPRVYVFIVTMSIDNRGLGHSIGFSLKTRYTDFHSQWPSKCSIEVVPMKAGYLCCYYLGGK